MRHFRVNFSSTFFESNRTFDFEGNFPFIRLVFSLKATRRNCFREVACSRPCRNNPGRNFHQCILQTRSAARFPRRQNFPTRPSIEARISFSMAAIEPTHPPEFVQSFVHWKCKFSRASQCQWQSNVQMHKHHHELQLIRRAERKREMCAENHGELVHIRSASIKI